MNHIYSRLETESCEFGGVRRDLWFHYIVVFLAFSGHTGLPQTDRLFLTAVDCYMGGCQLNRQWNVFYASLVPLECQSCVVSADLAPEFTSSENKITNVDGGGRR